MFERLNLNRTRYYIIFFFVSLLLWDVTFRMAGRMFLFSPWGATGNIVLSEKIFWLNKTQPDIVILGDSRAGNGLKPAVIERTLRERGIEANAINIWLPGTGLSDLLQIVERLIIPNPPKLVVITVNEKQLAESPPAKEIKNWDQRIILRWPVIEKFLEDIWWDLNLASGALLWGAFIKRATYNAFFGIAKLILFKQRPHSGSIGADKGYMRMEGKQKASRLVSQKASERMWFKDYSPSKEGAKKLTNLLLKIKTHNIKALIITMPVSEEMFEIFPKEAYNGFIREVEDIGRRLSISFTNYYTPHIISEDGFFDLQHMNDKGAEFFSGYFTGKAIIPTMGD